MKKRWIAWIVASVLGAASIVGCGAKDGDQAGVAQNVEQAQDIEETQEPEEELAGEADAEQEEVQELESVSEEASDEALDEASEEEMADPYKIDDDTVIRLGGLKGPTTMGLAKLIKDSQSGNSAVNVDFTMATAADELTAQLVQGKLDMAAIPCNLASVLYNKTEGAIEVLAVNTLGVLYIVDTGDSVKSLEDLKGKTIYATGEGTTPEYSLKHILKQNGIDPEKDVTFEWKSEATEIVSYMSSASEEVVALLPQPFVTVATTQVEGLNVAISLNDEWNKLGDGSMLVTGVLVVQKEFMEEHYNLVNAFMGLYGNSVTYTYDDVEGAAALIEELDITKTPIAVKALPNCNLVYIEGDAMKQVVSGYLSVLHEMNPQSVGGALPADDFYYLR